MVNSNKVPQNVVSSDAGEINTAVTDTFFNPSYNQLEDEEVALCTVDDKLKAFVDNAPCIEIKPADDRIIDVTWFAEYEEQMRKLVVPVLNASPERFKNEHELEEFVQESEVTFHEIYGQSGNPAESLKSACVQKLKLVSQQVRILGLLVDMVGVRVAPYVTLIYKYAYYTRTV
jgi:hypothetical protein